MSDNTGHIGDKSMATVEVGDALSTPPKAMVHQRGRTARPNHSNWVSSIFTIRVGHSGISNRLECKNPSTKTAGGSLPLQSKVTSNRSCGNPVVSFLKA